MEIKARSSATKAQAALEYLVAYVIAFMIIILAIVVLYNLFSAPSSNLPNTCTFSAGANCADLLLIYNSLSNTTNVVVLLNNELPNSVRFPSMLVSISGINYTPSACNPGYVQAGGSIICLVSLTTHSRVSAKVSGYLYLTEQNCALSTSNNCAGAANQVYVGKFTGTTQYGNPRLNFTISESVQNAVMKANGNRDKITSRVTLFGSAIKGATVLYTTDNVFYATSPPYSATNSTGVSTTYISSGQVGTVNIYANFSGYFSNALVTFVPP